MRILLTLPALGLAACTIYIPQSPPGTLPGPTPGPIPPQQCPAANYQQYVGQVSPSITLPAGTVSRSYRTGDPVTMDLNNARINFEYDRGGRLIRVSCG